MIRIARSDCPETLRRERPGQYNATDVVQALFAMQFGKCCYCESIIPEEGHAKAVEHFRPKSEFPDLAQEWTNLLLVCSQCNGKKSNKFPLTFTDSDSHPCVVRSPIEASPGLPLLIDPADILQGDPRLSIEFIVDDASTDFCRVIERNHCERGRATIDTVGLDRSYYQRRRFQHYKALRSYYFALLDAMETAKITKDLDDVTTKYNDLVAFVDQRQEYSAFSNDFCQHKCVHDRYQAFMEST